MRPKFAKFVFAAFALAGSAVSAGDPAVFAARHDADEIVGKDPLAAELLIRKAMARTHADDALRPWLAAALMKKGDLVAATAALDAGGFTPDGAGLGWRIRGQTALIEGRLPAAATAFDQALRFAPNDADLWVSIASLRFTSGQQVLAIAAADRAVALDPRNPGALALRGLLIREQYGLAASLPWFEAALQANPDQPALLDDYASTLGDMGQYRAMLIVARKLAEVDPKSQRPRLMEAVLAARSGQTDLARSILQRTGTMFREMPAAMLLSGVLEYRAGNFDLSVEVLEHLVRVQPDNLAARPILARALAAKGDWRRLADLFDGDVTSSRAAPALIGLVGQAWLHLAARESGDRARQDRTRAQALMKLAATTRRQAAVPLASDGTLPVLAQHYAENPQGSANAVPYIRALIAGHQVDAAQGVADRMRNQNAGNADAQMLAGDVHMAHGDARGALAEYTKAAAIRFNEAVLVRMDAGLRSVGRGGDADGMTSRYLAQNPQSAVAMTLLAAGWAGNPARSGDLAVLRRAMLARGTI
ncbi:tetratricopeptide repeat protein [Novosphingobium sp.]|uniref:tetratricopeptide repeat protein n=1 Tax=Novosphingobium sp. TaxID=1874826 RepID=UPI003D139788